MNFRSFRVNEDRHLESVEVDREQLTAEAENGPLWVDVESATPEEIEKLLAPLELHPLVIEGCVEPGDRIRVEPFDDAVLLSYPTGNIEHEIHYARSSACKTYSSPFETGGTPDSSRSCVFLEFACGLEASLQFSFISSTSRWTTISWRRTSCATR